jgi:hypothetical protein
VENFGTWRDQEGRLIWGINDLDEAAPLPYTLDLVRLAASAKLSLVAGHDPLSFHTACETLLQGYREGLGAPVPFVLAEQHARLRDLATHVLADHDPTRFWQRLEALPTVPGPVPDDARAALESQLPQPGLTYRVVHRQAGLGSLGRQRWLALADWRGGKVAREAKALAPPASSWPGPPAGATPGEPTGAGRGAGGQEGRAAAPGSGGAPRLYYEDLLARAVRAPDPFWHLRAGWIVRRLAPDCRRIELTTLPGPDDALHLLHAMSKETANLHAGSSAALPAILRDLAGRPADWLHTAALAMVAQLERDWQAWRAAA